MASRRWGNEKDERSKNLRLCLQAFCQQGPTYIAQDSRQARNLQRMPECTPSHPLLSKASQAYSREKLWMAFISGSGSEFSLDGSPATPLSFDFV